MVNIKATNRLFPQVLGYRSDGSVVACKELWLTHTSASDTSAGPKVGEIRYFSVLFNHIPLGRGELSCPLLIVNYLLFDSSKITHGYPVTNILPFLHFITLHTCVF